MKIYISKVVLVLLFIFQFNSNKFIDLKSNEKFESPYSKVDTIYAKQFGIIGDYNGIKGTDNRKKLQEAINFCSTHNKVLKLPAGKYLVNSYADDSKTHGNILELKSNTIIIGEDKEKTEIIVGNYFDNRPFILLSGFNHPDPYSFRPLFNIKISKIAFNFNSLNSYMKSGYLLRKGIELGYSSNVEISNCTFKDGDLTCAIGSGFGSTNNSKNVKIHHNVFRELIKSTQNLDHSTIYLNSSYSEIYNNRFTNASLQGKRVACATELHNSNTSFYDNFIEGYTRMMYIAAIENKDLHDVTVYNNTAKITNAAVYLWTDDSAMLKKIVIKKNKIYCSHLDGESMATDGTQGILCDAHVGANSSVSDINIYDNYTEILKTIYKGRAVNYYIARNKKGIILKNNKCKGCVDGEFYK